MRKNLLWLSLTVPLILSLLSVKTMRVAAVETHDIAVISVTPSSTSVRLGELVNITVVVENQGMENETFDVTAYYDTTAIGTKTVPIIEAGENKSLTFTWNTTDTLQEIYATTTKQKDYTINATASTVPGETEIGDNTLVSTSQVRVISQYIAVIPESTVNPDLTPGKNFTISIYTDYNGTDVWGWQLSLSYNPLILQGVKVTNGDLITTEKHPDAMFDAGLGFNNTSGKLAVTMAWFFYTTYPIPLTSGPGILANVTFTVVDYGTSSITLGVETQLWGVTEGGYGDVYQIVSDWEPVGGHLLNGYFRNTVAEITHDVAVISVTPSSTSVRLGELVNITVVVENQGMARERFDVTVYYNSTLNATKTIGNPITIILEAGANKSLTFAWNTTIVNPGMYVVTAEAIAVPGEIDIEDNTLETTVTLKRAEYAPLPLELFIALIVVVAIIAVATYAIYVKRRKKPTIT